MRNKKIHGIISLLILTGFISCTTGIKKTDAGPAKNLIGKWEGVDRTGKSGAFQFFDDGNVVLIIDGKSLGGSELNGLGKLIYSVDASKDPIHLDIIGTDQSGAEHGKILMIIRFMTRDKIKIRTYFNDVRPENFDEETIDDTIILDRQKD